MAREITATEAKRNFSGYIVVEAGYCELQNLLYGLSPLYYVTGKYGWNYDIYVLGDCVICTGYRGMFGDRDDESKKYEAKAKEIRYASLPYEEREKQQKELRVDYVKHLGGTYQDESDAA